METEILSEEEIAAITGIIDQSSNVGTVSDDAKSWFHCR